MHPDKASGPDGLNPAFFQQFWSILGVEVYDCCKEWLNSCLFPANLNDTNVVLIPKKENARCMKDLRPIALCNVLYKILAKVLANRLKTILPTLISENQSAFVPGRSITDNVLIAFEVIHHMQRKKASDEGEVALKLDISKAYDRVDWAFLKARMVAMGFDQKWIQWIMLCVTTVSYEFCFNGSSVGPIQPSRGLRQGDPLSPYLFLLCVEGLSDELSRAANDGVIHGSQVSQTAPTVTHLLFADDSFLFFRANNLETTAIKSLLNTYESLSGQSVNFQKSGILFSSNVKQSKRTELSAMLGVTNDLRNSKYLGLPSLVGRSKKKVFSFVKDKVWKRIQGWKTKSISRAGKTVLIKNGAQSIPSYCMSCFLLPKSLCQEIEKIMNKFWWSSNSTQSKGINWLSWGDMSSSKHKGGLGFRSLYGFNIALVGKQCWKFMKEPQSLVARIYKARYFPNCNFLQAKVQAGSSFIWNGLMTAKESLYKGYRWVLGNGVDIDAVRDPWLKDKEGFCVDQNKDYGISSIPVAEFIESESKSWDEGKVRAFFSEEDARLVLATRIPNGSGIDRIAWSRSTNGQYTVKTGYQSWSDANLANSNITQASGWSKIWRLTIPHKVKIFLWRFCRNNIPVRCRLRTKGVMLPIICPMCEVDIEHMLHVFFDCPFATSCWEYVGLQYDMSVVESAPDWLLQKISSASHEELMLIARTLWGIWFFRNKKVWDNKVVNNVIAMDWSAKYFMDWKAAKANLVLTSVTSTHVCQPANQKWIPPSVGKLKLNTDAAVRLGDDSYSVGLVLRDHLGSFIAGKVIRIKTVSSVFEAEVVAIKEGLEWLSSLPYQHVVVESDSLLAVQALRRPHDNCLEVGFVLDECISILRSRPGLSISFAKRQANRAAHLMAKIPCLLESQSTFVSPPSILLGTLMYDASS